MGETTEATKERIIPSLTTSTQGYKLVIVVGM